MNTSAIAPIPLKTLYATLHKYLPSLQSADLVGREYKTAFESWFRVELAQALISNRIARSNDVVFNYSYPMNSNLKADLSIGRSIAFELKCFCAKADANKKTEFPKQLNLLEQHVNSGHLVQSIGFFTLQGYGTRARHSMISMLTGPMVHWSWAVPFSLDAHNQVMIYIGEYHKPLGLLQSDKQDISQGIDDEL